MSCPHRGQARVVRCRARYSCALSMASDGSPSWHLGQAKMGPSQLIGPHATCASWVSPVKPRARALSSPVRRELSPSVSESLTWTVASES